MSDVAAKPNPARTSRQRLVIVDAIGYVFFAVGAFVALASHSVHQRIAIFERFSHTSEIIAGAVVALIGIALLITSDKLKRKAKQQGTTGAGA